MPGLSYADRIDVRGRLRRVIIVVTALFVILAARLVHLQVIEGVYYRTCSEHNQFRQVPLIAPRGLVLDKTGRILVDNRPAFALCAVPAEMGVVHETIDRLADLMPVDTAELERQIDAHRGNPYEHVIFERDVDFYRVTLVEENSAQLPGIITSVRPRRRYVLGSCGGNMLGHLGEVNRDEIDASPRFRPGSLIGRGGIEQMYDKQLRGSDGGLLIEVFAKGRPQLEVDLFGRRVARRDSLGRPLRTERDEAVPGNNVVLTIDAAIQQAAEQALDGLVGSVVVMDARTGGILALVSSPSYDPETFVSGDADAVRAVLTDPTHPMLHRAYQSTYAPGSTFKIVVAAAGLDSGEISTDSTVECTGSYRIGQSRPFRCWRRQGHGALNVTEALTYSCDVFFYVLGHRLGIERLGHYARLFGLGTTSGLDLPGEKPGFVPSPAWKRARFAHVSDPSERRWYPGETLNVSIGQGWLLATPLQMARVAAVIANGGYLVTPQIASRITDPGGRVVAASRPELPTEPIISARSVRVIREGLRRAVEKTDFPTGTGHLAKIPELVVLGKTGTAQVVSGYDESDDPLQLDIPYAYRDHAWFIGCVLDESLPVSFAVMVEHGGHGGDRAAPIARTVLEAVYGLGDSPAGSVDGLRETTPAQEPDRVAAVGRPEVTDSG